MAMITVNLKGGFKTVQEGERVLEITSAKVTPSGKPEKLTLQMKDVEDGASLMNNYNFNNDISLWSMGVMLNVALGLNDGDVFDTNDVNKLVGIKLVCEVTHSEYNGKTYANVHRVISKVDSNKSVNVELDQDMINRTLYGDDSSSDLS